LILILNIHLSLKSSFYSQHAQVIILAVKPDVVPQVLRELSQRVTRHHLIISIAAGATLQLLQHVSRPSFSHLLSKLYLRRCCGKW